uniref:Uncharacterized protein n=1 Tax=Arundo donax TaxID=35708 RepID=A0A0A9DIR1_ARUDO
MEQTSHLASLVKSSVETLKCLDALQQSVARHWEPSQFPGVVFVSRCEGTRLRIIFEGLNSDLTSYDNGRGMHGIDYRLLKDWNSSEIRFVVRKVILGTMNEGLPCASTKDAAITRTPSANLAGGIRPWLSELFQ